MSQAAYDPGSAGWPIEEREDLFFGAADDVSFPLVCRWPQGVAPKGFVVFCHGLSASGRDYADLSRCWARQGYLVVHPTFPDSIEAVAVAEPSLGLAGLDDLRHWITDERVRARMHEILHTPDYWLARIRIVGQVMDALAEIFDKTSGRPTSPIPGAIAGHSFGAYTSQLLAGAEIDLPNEGPRNFRDERFAVAILLSGQGRDQQGLREGSWDAISCPMLNITGTRDGGAKGQDWHWKVEPYEFAPPGGKYLAVLADADHYLGGIARPDQSLVPAQKKVVEQLTVAFLDAHLIGDERAKTWLGSIARHIGNCPLRFDHK